MPLRVLSAAGLWLFALFLAPAVRAQGSDTVVPVPDRSLLPSATLQNGCLQITYSQHTDASDLTYVVEVSGDLHQWNSGPGYTQPVSATPIDATRQQTVERDLIHIQNSGRRFIRVRIVK